MLQTRGLATVLSHARDFIESRLAAAQPANDGKQTPMRGHPAFVAQHATATCCRKCLARWHGIPAGRPLTAAESSYILGVLKTWLACQLDAEPVPRWTCRRNRGSGQTTLFDMRPPHKRRK
jgi:hypothetical protein